MTATAAQIASGDFVEVVIMALAYIHPDPDYPYRWKEWRDPDNWRWRPKWYIDPNGPLPPYSIPVLCATSKTALCNDICAAAGYDDAGTEEAKIRASVEILVAPYREAA